MIRYMWLVPATSMLAACGRYEGDGELEIDGYWPFRSYRLTLPEVALQTGVYRFDASGLPDIGSGPFVYLSITGQQPLVCTQLSVPVDFTLRDQRGEELLSISGPINAFIERAWTQDSRDWELEGAWLPWGFDYEDDRIEMQAVEIRREVDSLPQETCTFTAFDRVSTDLIATVEIELERTPIQGSLQIRLSETWK